MGSRYLDALSLLLRERGRLVTKDRFPWTRSGTSGVPVTDEALDPVHPHLAPPARRRCRAAAIHRNRAEARLSFPSPMPRSAGAGGAASGVISRFRFAACAANRGLAGLGGALAGVGGGLLYGLRGVPRGGGWSAFGAAGAAHAQRADRPHRRPGGRWRNRGRARHPQRQSGNGAPPAECWAASPSAGSPSCSGSTGSLCCSAGRREE